MEEAKGSGGIVFLYDDKFDNSLWKIIELNDNEIRLTPKHAQGQYLNCFEGKGHMCEVGLYHDDDDIGNSRWQVKFCN